MTTHQLRHKVHTFHMAELIPVITNFAYMEKLPVPIASIIHNRFGKLKTKAGIKQFKFMLQVMYECYFNAIVSPIGERFLTEQLASRMSITCAEQFKFWNN